MAYSFPDSPAEGQMVENNKVRYRFKGGAWEAYARSYAKPFNRAINSSMQISQQNSDTASTAAGWYPSEMWLISRNLATGVVNVGRTAVTTPQGSSRRIFATVQTAQAAMAAGEWVGLAQRIEGTRIGDLNWTGSVASRKPVVLRFGYRGPAGSFSAGLRNGNGADPHFTKLCTISAAQANTDVEFSISIPAPTIGTWLRGTASSLEIWFTFAAGANLTGSVDNAWEAGSKIASPGTSNGLATVGNSFQVFDVGLYSDPDNTGKAPPWQARPWLEDRIECMRYYQQQGWAQGHANSSAASNPVRLGGLLQAPMRAAPASSIIPVHQMSDMTLGTTISTFATQYTGSLISTEYDCTSAAAQTQFRANIMYPNPSGYLQQDART